MSEETRKNLLALAIVFVPLVVLAAFAFRPAPILGVSETELSEDLMRQYKELDSGSGVTVADCTEAGDDQYECTLGRRREPQAVAVTTDWAGCWEAQDRSAMDGCITLLDVFGDRPSITSDY